MSLCLAIDTATDTGSVAVGDGGSLIAEINVGHRRAAGTLMPAIHQCLGLADLTLHDLDAMAVADGPGSFTGLRIAFATVQGIVTQREVPVWVAPSLMVCAFAAGQPSGTPVAAVYDALREEVFVGVYTFSATEVTTLLAASRVAVRDLGACCPVKPAHAVGGGVVIYAAAIRDWTGNTPVCLPPPVGGPRASALLKLCGLEGGARSIGSLAEFEPNYGRHAEAQVRWEQEHGRLLSQG